ncbi:hypothetical protein VMCG_03588 [Cytospora schulzeri]|uniref:Uncharacterized protein n=1 Tax=Cytospora schulzeri TaxID=448051 RepID=A0A423WWF7_9PEZI|nr:hypothetical protein VMCG_03588 [Valsa malicola]
MGPPAKRQRLGLGPAETDDEDELDFDPEVLNQRRDPGYQLEQARDHAAYKLKSRFENIFAKYEKDFTGVGDEIDLRTGQVVVDNGHLESMRIGHRLNKFECCDARRSVGSGRFKFEQVAIIAYEGRTATSFLYDVFKPQLFYDAPSIIRLLRSFGGSGRQHGIGMGASARKVTRKALPAPRGQDEDDEDVLLGVSGNVLKRKESAKESPLIKRKFLTVDSSPHNDPGLNDLIQEVIENIPETPPSVHRPTSKLGTMRQLSGRKVSSQPNLEPKGKPRGRPRGRPRGTGAGKSRKKASIGENPDIPHDSGHASSPESPTGFIKARSNRKLVAGRVGPFAQPRGPGEDTSSFSEGDLELYQDVTGMPAIDSDSHSFYVEIEARNVNGFSAQKRPHTETIRMRSMGPEKQKSTLSTAQGTFERNVIDPTFTFSDEETLPPRDTRKGRRKSEPAKLVAQPVLQVSRPNLQRHLPSNFERNVVDPSYAFSDEENLLPRRAKTSRREPQSATDSKLSANEDSSAFGELDHASVSESRETHDSPSARKGKRQPMRSARKPDVAVDTSVYASVGSVSSNALPAESEAEEVPHSANTAFSKSRTQNPRGNGPTKALVSVHRDHLVDQEVESVVAESSSSHPRSVRRRPGRQKKVVERIASPELGEPAFEAAGPSTEQVERNSSETGPLPTATSAPPHQPSTPRTKSKAADKNTPSSKPGLISLLSDNEDDEDEISFDLSAFTPSGHHRILARGSHNPHSTTTTPHTASNSTVSKKKQRASSTLLGPSSTSKIRKHRTPGSERKDGKGKRRGSTNSLARSVVKVRRESFRAPSPTGSVVQTPGGTKRRCGLDGFRCERDFCFVCISI